MAQSSARYAPGRLSTLHALLGRLRLRPAGAGPLERRRRFRPRLEQLEDRTLLNGPSAFGHITDGQFDVINGHQEWSDITPTFFAATHSYLYADQANLHHPAGSSPDTFMLMYDDVGQTTPLGPNQYIPIRFNTVENENGHDHLNFYEVHIFTDGTITFLENGVVQHDDNGNIRVREIGGQQGQVGFGPSPNSSTPHVMAEFQITLSANQTVLNGGYSPDPLFWSSDPSPPPPPPCPPDTFTSVPVLINIYQGSGVTPAQAMQYVRDANTILRNALNNAVNLVPVIDQTGLPGGQMSITDRSAARTAGDSELSANAPGGKGLKIDFIQGYTDSTADGLSIQGGHTSIIPNNAEVRSDEGYVIAHEIGHDFGLDDVHGTANQSNLMYDTFQQNGRQLNSDQMKTVCGNLSNYGTTVTRHSPGQLAQQQGGSVSDDINDIGPGVASYFDLGFISADSTVEDDNIHAQLTLNGPFPTSGPVDATYRLLFNTDNNTATGITSAGFSGIDKEVLIHVTGDASIAPLSVSGIVIDYSAGGRQTPLPSNPQLIAQLSELGFASTLRPVGSQILVDIPKSLLNLSADDVPVGVVSQNAAGIQDTASLVFDADLYLDEPALNLTQASAFVNDPVNFTIQNLHPNSAFTLTLGGQQVLTGTTDSTGSFSGTFTVPSLPSGNTYLTAQDATGAIAFNALDIFPPLGTSAILPGFNANTLPGNDDGSTGAVPLGFTVNFFGHNYSSLYVNNNGNVTFDSPLSEFTPFDLSSTGHVIIAPFFADVDTRLGNVLTYGTGTVDGHPAFGVTWPGVGYFAEHTDKLNAFQMVLIDRSDFAPGDFDIEFNYGQIQWETGDASSGVNGFGGSSARVGFSNGTGQPGTFFELPGSAVNGAFLDSNAQTGLIHNSANSPEPGQYLFQVRAGTPLLHNTAAFLQANADGTTTVEPTSLVVGQEPSLLDRLVRIVQFRVAAGLTASATQLTNDLVDGLVEDGFISPRQADALIASVLATLGNRDDLGLLLLDPTGPQSLLVAHGGRVTVNGGGAVVVDSSDLGAAFLNVHASVTAADIDVTGGFKTLLQSHFSGPVDHEAAAPDPLGLSLPAPPSPTHAAVQYSGSLPLTLQPGTYIGGIAISGSGPVTLAPGVYYMQGGGFSVTGQGTVRGTGVTIINAPAGPGDTISVSGQGSLSLTAPTSGPFRGVVLFQDPRSSNPIQFTDQASVTLTGVAYVPAALVSLDGFANVTINPGPGTAAQPSILGALIAYDLKVDGAVVLTINPDDPPSAVSSAVVFGVSSKGGTGTVALAVQGVPVSGGSSAPGDDSLVQAAILLSRRLPANGKDSSPAPVMSSSTSAANATLVDALFSGNSRGTRAGRSAVSKGVKSNSSAASGVDPLSEPLVDAVFSSL